LKQASACKRRLSARWHAIAAEIQSAGLKQSEAFMRFADRIERVEKNSDTAPMRDALRGLHQGVSRLPIRSPRQPRILPAKTALLAEQRRSDGGEDRVRARRIGSSRKGDRRAAEFALSDRVKQMEERSTPRPARSRC
jgi:hypothetical protein